MIAAPANRTSASPLGSPVIAAALLAYAGLEIALFVTHLPWRDEGQAWLWAKHISTFQEFFIVPGEGHPPLWFWLLKALSTVLNFDQARLFSLALALVNAGLIVRLLRDDLVLIVLVLFSAFSLHYWGYIFRPYTLVFTLSLLALLADRAGKPLRATCFMAVACGFHFFSGFLFTFWLALAWRRGLRLPQLATPALLALVFGLLAIVSGQTNTQATLQFSALPLMGIQVFGAPFAENFYPLLIAGPVSALLIAYALRRDWATLTAFFAASVLFCTFAVVVYGRYDWHLAFLSMLLLMAYVTAKPKPTRWPMLILFVPGMVFGVSKSVHDIATTANQPELAAYQAILEDVGPQFDSQKALVVWPDFIILGLAARYEFRFVSGNTGAIGGPIDLSTGRRDADIDTKMLTNLPKPYWLYCFKCQPILAAIKSEGRLPVMLYQTDANLGEDIAAYRIE